MFLHGLADRIQREIDVVELPPGLDELVDLALRVDAQLQQRNLRGRRKLTPEYPFIGTLRSVTRWLTNPCRWVELGSPGRREIVGRGGDYACTAARLATSWRVFQ